MKPNSSLRKERERRGWSQASVAEKLGVDVQTVSRWERGISYPYPHMREQLAQLFQKDVEALGLLAQAMLTPVPANDIPFSTPQSLIDPIVPLPMSEFGLVGRDELYEQLKSSLLHNQQPGGLAVLCGLPGVGKTTLATALAHDAEIRAYFTDGVLWAGAGPTPNTIETLMRWHGLLTHNATYPFEQEQSSGQLARAVHNQTAQRRMLLIIDDVWELETLQVLRLGGYHCFHLVTTRVPQIALQFAPDNVWTIPELDEQESISLLTRYLSRSGEQDQALFRTLAQAVGGLSLALSLIGRYLRTQSATNQPRRLQAAIQRVCDPVGRLCLGEPQPLAYRPALVGTLLSLESVIAVSEQQITAQARQALQMLSCFPPKPNSFSEELALAATQLSPTIFDELYDCGLIESPEPARYQLHSTIADYARLHTTQSDVLPLCVERIIAYLETHSADYNVLEQENRNAVAILEFALEQKLARLYIRGVLALSPFWEIRGLYTLAMIHLQQALQLARDEQHMDTLVALLAHLGQVARQQNQSKLAEEYLQEGLLCARHLGDEKMISHFLINLAELCERRRAFIQAYDYLREGLALSCHLPYEERTNYHRMTTWIGEANICVYFTEPQQMLQRGYLADINELFEQWPYAKYLAPQWLDVVRGADSHVYGLPVNCYDLCLVYNRRLFREAGLDPDQPPTTWSEFRAVAKKLTNSRKDIYGFAEATIYNSGGWRFTNWLYSAGGDAERYKDGTWHATFHRHGGAECLDMLREMRFSDQSIHKALLLSAHALSELFCHGQIGMFITGSSTLYELHGDPRIQFDDVGIGPMPQQGGNACLFGGVAHVFNTRARPEVIQSTFQHLINAHFTFDLQRYEQALKMASARNEPIGLPGVSLFVESFQQQLKEIEASSVNVPLDKYRVYLNSQLTPKLEPPREAQNYYALIDPIVQSVLTNPHTRIQPLLDAAAQQFQEQYLDRIGDA